MMRNINHSRTQIHTYHGLITALLRYGCHQAVTETGNYGTLSSINFALCTGDRGGGGFLGAALEHAHVPHGEFQAARRAGRPERGHGHSFRKHRLQIFLGGFVVHVFETRKA